MEQLRLCIRRTAFCALILVLSSFAASIEVGAQFKASIQGTVADPNGALISDAKVILTSKETGRELQAVTNKDGFYRFTSLAPGNYKLAVEHGGFKRKELDNIMVSAEAPQG